MADLDESKESRKRRLTLLRVQRFRLKGKVAPTTDVQRQQRDIVLSRIAEPVELSVPNTTDPSIGLRLDEATSISLRPDSKYEQDSSNINSPLERLPPGTQVFNFSMVLY